MKRLLSYIIVLVVLSACAITPSQQTEQKPLRVEAMTIASDTTVSLHTYVGEIVAESSVTISATAMGRVLSVNVHVGDKVREGDVLFTIDSTQALNARQSAEALLRQAEDGHTRAARLFKEGGVTEQKMVEIESQLMQARAMMAAANKAVSDCRVTSPVAGVVGTLHVSVGQSIAPAVPALTLMNMNGYKVRFAVSESEIAGIRLGDHATMDIPAVDAKEIALRIVERSLIPNRLAHTYDVTASVVSDIDLLPGMMAKVRLEHDKQVGYIVPQSCVQLLPDGAKVWVVDGDVAIRRGVTTGKYIGDGVLVIAGLSVGEKVVTAGYQKLYSGCKVEIGNR